jgi:hypothetical protein
MAVTAPVVRVPVPVNVAMIMVVPAVKAVVEVAAMPEEEGTVRMPVMCVATMGVTVMGMAVVAAVTAVTAVASSNCQ